MIYETNRLDTREMATDDLGALSKLLQDSEVMTAYEHAFSEEETYDWLNRQFDRYRTDGHGLWAVILKETGEMVGQCGITIQDYRDTKVHEIGYLFQKEHWHKGYAIEAAAGSKKYAFEVLKLKSICSIIRNTNIASMNVAIRNGMVVRDIFIKHYYGMDMPHFLFAVENSATI